MNEYQGLDGVNNYAALNHAFATIGDRFYTPPKKEEQKSTEAKSEAKDSDILPWGQIASDLSDAVNRMFRVENNKTWAAFSSTKWYEEAKADASGFMSLEYIHNNM